MGFATCHRNFRDGGFVVRPWWGGRRGGPRGVADPTAVRHLLPKSRKACYGFCMAHENVIFGPKLRQARPGETVRALRTRREQKKLFAKIACNPLKRLISDERIQGNPSFSNPSPAAFPRPKGARPRKTKSGARPPPTPLQLALKPRLRNLRQRRSSVMRGGGGQRMASRGRAASLLLPPTSTAEIVQSPFAEPRPLPLPPRRIFR